MKKVYFIIIILTIILIAICAVIFIFPYSKDYISDFYEVEFDQTFYSAEFDYSVDIENIINTHNERTGDNWKLHDPNNSYSERFGKFKCIEFKNSENVQIGVVAVCEYLSEDESKENYRKFLFEVAPIPLHANVRFANICIDGPIEYLRLFLNEIGIETINNTSKIGQIKNLYRENLDFEVADFLKNIENMGYSVYNNQGYTDENDLQYADYCIISSDRSEYWYLRVNVSEDSIQHDFDFNKLRVGYTSGSCTIVVTSNNCMLYCRNEESLNKLIADINGG